MVEAWFQNVVQAQRNGRIGRTLEFGEPHFHAAIDAIWNAIFILERFCRILTKIKTAIEIAF